MAIDINKCTPYETIKIAPSGEVRKYIENQGGK